MSLHEKTLIQNAKLVTFYPLDRIADAIAISGDRVLAVGDNTEIESLTGPNSRKIDAKGHVVIPGLIDGHAHMDREGLKDIPPTLAGCRSIDDILQRIEAIAAETPKGEWIVTMPIGELPLYYGLPANLAEKRVPNRQEIDRVAPDHPV